MVRPAIRTGALMILLGVAPLPLAAAVPEPNLLETPPERPISEGKQVFAAKGCVQCHAVRDGAGAARVGPDLARRGSWSDVMQFAGSLWNHKPAMSAKLREQGIERPAVSPDDMSKLVSYLFAVKFFDEPGNAARGRELFEQRSCAHCHQLGGRGGTVGPRLDELKDYMSPSFMAQSLWNHGPDMAVKMAEQKLVRPRLEPEDVSDIVAYIRGDTPGAAVLDLAYAQAGSPQAGKNIFAQKGCSHCHAIGGVGGTAGPDLGVLQPQAHVGEMAAALWNHGPLMWAKMKEVGRPVPKLSDAEMADLLAYLHFVQYMGHGGNATRGREIFRTKSCSACHAAGGEGRKGAADLAASSAIRSSFHWAAAIWNHPLETEEKAGEPQRASTFDDDEMRDLVEFLRAPGGGK
jgi:mono/diheme cytochrome c family protein